MEYDLLAEPSSVISPLSQHRYRAVFSFNFSWAKNISSIRAFILYTFSSPLLLLISLGRRVGGFPSHTSHNYFFKIKLSQFENFTKLLIYEIYKAVQN
jgi:hypothetical protein